MVLFLEHSLDFFNWNKVKIRYCDGASFAGHPENELKVSLYLWEILCLVSELVIVLQISGRIFG
jgi:hypothetical protein